MKNSQKVKTIYLNDNILGDSYRNQNNFKTTNWTIFEHESNSIHFMHVIILQYINIWIFGKELTAG